MKISDLLVESIPTDTNDKIRWAMKTMVSFSNSHRGIRSLDEAYKICIEHLPNARYTGDMYRGVSVDPKELVLADTRMLLSRLHRYAQAHPREVVSWSTSPDTAINIGAISTAGAGIVFHQHSTGLDTNNLYHEASNYRIKPTFYTEKEIFAYPSNSISLYGFVAVTPNGDPAFYNIDEFNDFVKVTRLYQTTQ